MSVSVQLVYTCDLCGAVAAVALPSVTETPWPVHVPCGAPQGWWIQRPGAVRFAAGMRPLTAVCGTCAPGLPAMAEEYECRLADLTFVETPG